MFGLNSPSASAVTTATPAASAIATTVTLSVSTTSGPAFQPVSLSGTVAAPDDATTPTGSCRFTDSGVPLAITDVSGSGSCEYTSTAFSPGPHVFSVEYVPTQGFAGSSSPDSAVEYDSYDCLTGDLCDDPTTVLPPLPRGQLVVATPYTPAHPFDLGTLVLASDGASYDVSARFGSPDEPAGGVTIIDTRSGGLPFTAQLAAGEFRNGDNVITGGRLGFVEVTPVYIAGNGISARTKPVTVTDIPSLSTAARTFVSGTGPGSVFVTGRLALTGVPTSTPAGRYIATVTFTIS